MRRVAVVLTVLFLCMSLFPQNEREFASVDAGGDENCCLRLLVREPRVVVLKSYDWHMVFDDVQVEKLNAMLEQGLKYFELVEDEEITINVRTSIGSMRTNNSKKCQVLFENRRRAEENSSFVDLYYFEHEKSREPAVVRFSRDELGELTAALDKSQAALDDLERQLALF